MAALRLLVLLVPLALCSGQDAQCSYWTLFNHLNLSSSPTMLTTMRPVKDWRNSTLVHIDLLVYGLLQLDEKFQTLTSHVWIEMSWPNEFLKWDPAQFCDISNLQVPASMLWIPDVGIQEDTSDTSSVASSPLLGVTSDGLVTRAARQRLTSTCNLNLRLFPFDTQTCLITFSSFTSLNSKDDSLILDGYRNNTELTKISRGLMVTKGEWALKNLAVTVHAHNKTVNMDSSVSYKLVISRKPMLYVVNLIVPLFYLLVLDVASFFVHASKGEKLSFKITVLLSISVLLLILQDMLPSTEDDLPMIAVYFVAVFALVGISVLETMLVLFIMDMEAHCSKKFSKPVKGDKPLDELDPEDKIQVENIKGTNHNSQSDAPGGRQLLKQILRELKTVRQMVANQDSKEETPLCGLAVVIDSVFFVAYLFTIIVFLTFMYVYWISLVVV